MQIILKNQKFVAISSYDEKDIPKSAGFRWNPASKCWWTSDASIARKLAQYADAKTLKAIDAATAKKEETIQASKAVDANIDIPAPDGLSYLPFQKAGIAFAASRTATLIADEMGLGKTIQAIGSINADAEIKKVLVICPASLRLNWQRELRRWLTRPLSISITNGTIADTDIVIINYDILKKHSEYIHSQEWDLLITDECHYLKNPKTLRTQQVFGGKDLPAIKAKKKIFLTGTPIVNRPIELWPLVHSLDPAGLGGNWIGYAKRYCDGHQTRYGWEVKGASNLDELQDKLRSSIMVRRLKKDVLTELPAKRRQVIELPANGCGNAVKVEIEIFEKHEKIMAELKIAVELAKASDSPDAYQQAIDRLRDAGRIAFTEISKLRHSTALAKVPAVIEHLKDATDGAKVVVFAHHHDVIDAIAAEFGLACVTLTGDTNMIDRQKAVDRFQTDPACTLFVGSITAAGVGITLTAASHVVFSELTWRPGDLCQAEDRCHRIGQVNSVLVQHIVLDGSIDATMAKTLIEKQEIIEKALDREHEKIEDDEVETEVEQAIITVEAKEQEAATKRLTREKITVEAKELTKDQILAIHQGLQILAENCDGAHTKDHAGFNRIDANIGRNLADQCSLTARQAVLGKKIILKYHRQLPESFLNLIK